MPKGTFKDVLPEDLDYQAWKADCLGKVAEWRYTANAPQFWDPIALKREPIRFLPTEKEARHAHGFDAQGRLLISESTFARPRRTGDAELIRYRGDAAYCGGFYDGNLMQYHKYVLRDGKVVEYHALGGVNVEEDYRSRFFYHYDGNDLVSVRFEFGDGDVHEGTYDASGNQTGSWRIKPNGERVSLEEKPLPKGVNLKTLTAKIRERLPKLIQKTVAAAKVKEPVYCVALAYDGEGNGVMPPYLGLGVDSERQKWIEEHGTDAKDIIWNPEEFTHFEKKHTQWEDDEFDQLCEWYNQLMADRDSEAPAINLLNEVAVELTGLDWSKKLKVTPDFVVYAVDFELGDLSKNLKKSVPPVLHKKLKAAKLI